MKIGFWTVVINLLLSLAFLRWTELGAGGLALAYSLSSIFNVILALAILGKRLPALLNLELLATVGKSSAASVLMGICVAWTFSALEAGLAIQGKLGEAVQTLGAITLGVLVYLILAAVLRMDEVRFVWGLIKGKLKRRRGAKEEG